MLRDEEAHSDVVREAQELVELALKGMLRAVGLEPPKFHDVGGLLLEHETKFSGPVRGQLPRAAEISKRLRRERELAFYGDIDFIPTEEYSPADSERAYGRGGVGGRARGRGHRAPRDVASETSAPEARNAYGQTVELPSARAPRPDPGRET